MPEKKEKTDLSFIHAPAPGLCLYNSVYFDSFGLIINFVMMFEIPEVLFP